MRQPKLMIAAVLLVLIALAGTMTYTGFLVIGVLADQLSIGRFLAGLLLGVLFARVPWFSQGKLRTVGLLPKPVRRPVIFGLLGLCLFSFLARSDYVPAMFMGFAVVFLLAFPWLRRAIMGRMVSSVFRFAPGQQRPQSMNDNVIDVEFTEKKD